MTRAFDLALTNNSDGRIAFPLRPPQPNIGDTFAVQSLSGNDIQLVFQPLPAVVSGALPLLGGTMLGPLYLSRDPTLATEAATRSYVDAKVGTIFNIRGGWNASTNVPALSNGGGGGAKGDVFTVTTAGSTTIDGVSTWAVGDQLQNTGTLWVKVAYSTAFGTLAFINAASVGALAGLTTLTFTDTSLIGLGNSLMPDLVWWRRDLTGNIVVAMDFAGVSLFQAIQVFGSATFASVTGTSASYANGTFTNATIGTLTFTMGDYAQAGNALQPDVSRWVRGDNGQLLLGFGSDGAIIVKDLVATNSVTAPNISGGGGGSTPAATVPVGSLDITAAPYNAIGDGEDDFFLGTWTAGSNTLTLTRYTGAITWTGTSLTLNDLANTTSPGFAPDVVGQSVFVTDGATVTATTTITAWVAANQVTVADPPPASITTGTVNWPAFKTTSVGKVIRVEAGNANTTRQAYNNGNSPWVGTIASVIDGHSITVTGPVIPNFTSTNNGRPTRVSWGSSNRAAYIAIGADLLARGVKHIYHPRAAGRGKTVYIGDNLSGRGGLNDYFLNINTLGTPKLAWMHGIWIGEPTVVGVLFCNDGELLPKRLVPSNADAPPQLNARDLIAKRDLLRVVANTAIAVSECGDSLSSQDITNASTAWWATDHFETSLVINNLKKAFSFTNTPSAGLGWGELVDPSSGLPWLIPGTDLFYLSSGGTNDAWRMHPLQVQAGINLAKANGNDAGGRAPDVILVANYLMNFNVDPGTGTAALHQSHIFSHVLLRSMAHVQGLGFIDQSTRSEMVMHGASNFHRDLRQLPDVMGFSLTPATPFTYMADCSSWSMVLHLSATNVWTAIGSLRVSLSPMPGNEFVVDVDPVTARLRYEARLWGRSCPTTVTTSGSTITTAAGAAMTTGTMTWVAGQNVVNIQAGGCNGLTVGECIYFPGIGLNGQHQRSYVNRIIDDTHVVVDDFWQGQPGGSQSTPTFTGTVTPIHGGQTFLNDDARAQCDVYMRWGTSEYRGKITGFTDANHATLTPAPPALTNQAVQMWIGRSSVPPVVSSVGSGLSTVTVKYSYNRDIFSLRIGGSVSTTFMFRGPVERWGNRYSPKVSITGAGPVTCDFQNLFGDRDLYFLPLRSIVDAVGTGDVNSGVDGGGPHAGSITEGAFIRRVFEALDWNAS